VLLVYLDASALAKRYSPESGSEIVNELFRRLPIQQINCATLGILEVVSILVRKRNDERLTPSLYAQALTELERELINNDIAQSTLINDHLILSGLGLIRKHNINASDAIILRSVLNLQNDRSVSNRIIFWCSDRRLIRAAAAEGIEIFNPETDTLQRFTQLHG